MAIATQEDAHRARAKTSRSAVLAVVAGGNLCGVLAVLAVWWLDEHDLIAGPPFWVYLLLILASIASDVASGYWYRRRPGSRIREQVRVAVPAGATTVILYATGWGSLLGIGYALCAVQLLAQLRKADWRMVFGWCVAGVTAGEVAIATGVAPSMVSSARSHAMAASQLLLLAVVLWVVSGILAARDAVEHEVRERGKRLAHEAATDSLTQLPNRAAFTDALERSCAARQPATLAFVDLDNFKDINDTFGHRTGDDVLVEVAARLRQVVRAGDMIARFGGDEFVLLVKSRDAPDAGRMVERIWEVLAEPWPMIAPNIITASVGVVDDHDGTRSPDDLLSQADKAMYARKQGLSSTGSMTAMTSRALAHHRLAMDRMRGSFVVLHAIRQGGEIVDYEIVEANSIVRNGFASTCGEVVGALLSKLNAAADNTAVLPLYEKALSTGECVTAELHLAQPGGPRVWRSMNIVAVDLDTIAVVANDITAEVDARELLERRVRFARLIARSSDLGCVVDAAGTVVYAPSWGTAFLGYTSEELGPPLSRVAPGDRDEATAWFDEVRALPSGTEARSVALRFVAPDGVAHTCDVTATNWSDDSSIGGIVLNVHDVSAVFAAEARLAAVADAMADVIVICDKEARIMWVSGAIRDALDLEPDELVGVAAFDLIHPDDHAQVAARLGQFVADNTPSAPIDLRMRLRRADGTYRWFDCRGKNQLDDPSIRGLVISLRDSTDRRAAETALRMSEERNRSIVEAAADAIISVDHEGIIQSFNRAAEHIFGTRAVDTIGVDYTRFLPSDSQQIVRSALQGGRVGQQIDTIAVRASGERFAAQVAVSEVQVGENILYTAVVRDISDQRAMEQALRIAATCDELTGLANRRTLLDRAETACVEARRTNEVVGMVFIDLDRFKLVNDGLGHDAGDQLLVLVADRIAAAIRAQDVVARLGSDEFVVLCPSASDLDAIKVVALRILEVLALPFAIAGNEVVVGASIGVSVGTGSETPLELLRSADTAMYRAKAERSTGIEVFDAQMEQHAARRLDLESALRQAVGRDELLAYYQPIVDLNSGQPSYFEALVRWDRPGVGLIRPDDFIPVAEEAGIITEIGPWVLGRAPPTACVGRAWRQASAFP